jgi:IclR family transcriptional regulator, acetate operon repressor
MRAPKKVASGRPRSNPEPAGQVQSLARGLNVLQQLAESVGGLTLTEVAARVDLPNSTTHRLLTTLEQNGFVHQDTQLRRWQIGVQTFAVGNAYLNNRDFVAMARPLMQQLVAQTGETSNLGILDKKHVVFIAQVECTELMRMVVKLGSRSPVHASGVGKSLLAHWHEKELLKLIKPQDLKELTQHTITDLKAFKNELSAIAARGYAIDDEEQIMGLRCVAANIYNEFGDTLAAISVSGPTQRISTERLISIGETVKQAANKITLAIGGQVPSKNLIGNARD